MSTKPSRLVVGLVAAVALLSLVAVARIGRLVGWLPGQQPTATKPEAAAGSGRVAGPPLVHPSGLILEHQAPTYQVRETETGFHITPSNAAHLRSAWSVELRFAPSLPFESAGAETTRSGARDAHFRVHVDDDDVGSGGPLHTLTAWTSCGPGHLVMTTSQQAESPQRPDWSLAWAIFADCHCAGPR